MLYRVKLDWVGFELTILVVIGTDCTGSCKSNYHTITTTTAPTSTHTISTYQHFSLWLCFQSVVKCSTSHGEIQTKWVKSMIHGCKTIFFFIYIDESSQKWLKVVCKKYRNLTKNVCDLTAEHGDMQRQLIISLVKYGIMGKYCQCWIHILKDDWFILFISIVWSFIFSSPVWAIAITWRLATTFNHFWLESSM
jgi:hypothetical protein